MRSPATCATTSRGAAAASSSQRCPRSQRSRCRARWRGSSACTGHRRGDPRHAARRDPGTRRKRQRRLRPDRRPCRRAQLHVRAMLVDRFVMLCRHDHPLARRRSNLLGADAALADGLDVANLQRAPTHRSRLRAGRNRLARRLRRRAPRHRRRPRARGPGRGRVAVVDDTTTGLRRVGRGAAALAAHRADDGNDPTRRALAFGGGAGADRTAHRSRSVNEQAALRSSRATGLIVGDPRVAGIPSSPSGDGIPRRLHFPDRCPPTPPSALAFLPDARHPPGRCCSRSPAASR